MTTEVKKENEMQRLTQLDAEEVSIVTTGANRKKFSVIKSEHGVSFQKAMDGDQDAIKNVLKVLFEKVSDDTLTEMGLQRASVPAEGGVEKNADGTPVSEPATSEGVAKEVTPEVTPEAAPEATPEITVAKADFDALVEKVASLETTVTELQKLNDEVKKIKEDPRISTIEERVNKISNSTTTQVPEIRKHDSEPSPHSGGMTLGLGSLDK